METKKGKRQENFLMGAYALREGESHEAGRVPMHWEASLQVGPRGSCGISESQAKLGLRQISEKVVLLSPQTAHGLWPQPDGRLGEPEEPTEALCHRRQAGGAKRRIPKPLDKEGPGG